MVGKSFTSKDGWYSLNLPVNWEEYEDENEYTHAFFNEETQGLLGGIEHTLLTDASILKCLNYPDFDSPGKRCTVLKAGSTSLGVQGKAKFDDGVERTVTTRIITVIAK